MEKLLGLPLIVDDVETYYDLCLKRAALHKSLRLYQKYLRECPIIEQEIGYGQAFILGTSLPLNMLPCREIKAVRVATSGGAI